MKSLVDLDRDGTDNLFREDMLVDATIDKDMLPVEITNEFHLDGADDVAFPWLAGLGEVSLQNWDGVFSQRCPRREDIAQGTERPLPNTLPCQEDRHYPRNLRFRFA